MLLGLAFGFFNSSKVCALAAHKNDSNTVNVLRLFMVGLLYLLKHYRSFNGEVLLGELLEWGTFICCICLLHFGKPLINEGNL